MEKEFVTYEQALALKELGFDEPCLAFYDGTWDTKIYFNYKRDSSGDYEPFTTSERLNWFGVPLKSQVFEWFREEHGLNHMIDMNFRTNNYITQLWKGRECFFDEHSIKTYEEAESACIDKLIEIVKSK